MVKIFSQSHHYEDSWSTVVLAFFLRYPNRYARHVISCDVVDRYMTTSGTLHTTRLILKRGALPMWFPRGFVHRAESWIIEETEVDVFGKVLHCKTRNLDHVKVVKVIESVTLQEAEDGTTIHRTDAQFKSALGWGLTRRIEEYSASRFKNNIEKSRQGISLVLRLLREARIKSLSSPFGMMRVPIDDFAELHSAAVSSTQPVSDSQEPLPNSRQITTGSPVAESPRFDEISLRPNTSPELTSTKWSAKLADFIWPSK